jgi:hypothetical protein
VNRCWKFLPKCAARCHIPESRPKSISGSDESQNPTSRGSDGIFSTHRFRTASWVFDSRFIIEAKQNFNWGEANWFRAGCPSCSWWASEWRNSPRHSDQYESSAQWRSLSFRWSCSRYGSGDPPQCQAELRLKRRTDRTEPPESGGVARHSLGAPQMDQLIDSGPLTLWVSCCQLNL